MIIIIKIIMMVSTNWKYIFGSKIMSFIFIKSLMISLYLLNFPNKKFISWTIFLTLIITIHFFILSIRYMLCRYNEYFVEYFRFWLNCNIYLSNFLISIYFLSFPCGSKCLDEIEAKYFTLTIVGSFLNCIISVLMRNHLFRERIDRIQPTNLREILIMPTYRDQLLTFSDQIKGETVNKDITEKEEIIKSIVDEILFNIFLEKNEEICSICLTEINGYQKLAKLECNHTYHLRCLFECYKNNIKTCGLCRTNYLKNNDI